MGNDNRTFVCCVAFIDIVEYSKKSVAEQMRAKEQFNLLLAQALADVPGKDRIILDTGDGAAISFLGDPEDGLFLGLALRDALAERSDETLRLRIGVNLGPVRLVKDINGQPNIIGDGINVAQRVMSFAAINQVLASRSYYEVVSRWFRRCRRITHTCSASRARAPTNTCANTRFMRWAPNLPPRARHGVNPAPPKFMPRQ